MDTLMMLAWGDPLTYVPGLLVAVLYSIATDAGACLARRFALTRGGWLGWHVQRRWYAPGRTIWVPDRCQHARVLDLHTNPHVWLWVQPRDGTERPEWLPLSATAELRITGTTT